MNNTDIYRRPQRPPTSRVTVVTSQTENHSVAAGLDVDTLHAAIRSAEAGNTELLFTIYRDMVLGDSHIQAELAKRKLAVIGDKLVIQPFDKKVATDAAAAEKVERMLANSLPFLMCCAHLLDATVYPVSLVEKVFIPSRIDGLRYEIADLITVPHRLLDYRTGRMRVSDTDANGRVQLTTKEIDSNRYITHRGHLLSFPDNFGGPMRSLVFWWLLSVMDRSWWARFLDRYGSPFIVAKYPSGDDASRVILESALAWATKIGGLVVNDGTTVELKEASAGSGDAYEKFLGICRREISRLILGQTLSAEAQSTGLGSGVSKQHEAVRQDIRNFDALMLGHTIRMQLIKPWLDYNGIPGEPPLILWPGDTSESVARLGALARDLHVAGIELDDEGISTISEQTGIGMRRRTPATALPTSLSVYSMPTSGLIAADEVSRGASATLAQAIRARHAEYRQIILSSRSADEALERVTASFADLSSDDIAELISRTLRVYAANAALATGGG
jgi:phage gp29-like protein